MVEFRRILCPIDFSDYSQHAIDYAVTLARWYDARLVAVHSVPVIVPVVSPLGGYPMPIPAPDPDLQAVRAQLEGFLEPARRLHVPYETVVETGEPVDTILRVADDHAVDLIVLGTHGRGGFERMILGSVTEKVLRKARCPVLTVPKRVQHIPGSGELMFKTIVCPVDFSPSSMRALSLALSLAEEGDARVTIVHVLEWFTERAPFEVEDLIIRDYRRQAEEDARARLAAAITPEARVYCHPEEVLVAGKPHREILRLAEQHHADLIVMGVHGRSAVDVALFGSTTTQVVRGANCAVLTLRSE